MAYDAEDNEWNATSSAAYSISPGAGGSWTDNIYSTSVAGTWVVTGTYSGQVSTATLTVNVGALSSIAICTDEYGQSPAGTHTMTADDTWTLYAAGYDSEGNFIANQPVTWAGTGALVDVSGSGTSHTVSPTTAGLGTVTVSDGVRSDATGLVTVNPGALASITICTDDAGQHPADTHTMTVDDTWTLYAAGYDADGNFIANQSVTWDETGTLDNVSGTGASYMFSPFTAGTSGTITVNDGSGHTDATGTVTVTVGGLASITICTDDAGQNPADTHTMTTDQTWTLYAAGYDTDGNFIANFTVAWDETGTLDSMSASDAISYTFEPSTAGTSGTIAVEHASSGQTDVTGLVTVNVGALASITICTDGAGQTPAGTHTMTTDDTWTLYAAGYDSEGNFIANQAVDWNETGTLDDVSASGVVSYTFDPSTADTSGTIAVSDGVRSDATGTVTVNVGALASIEICTDAFGQNPAGDHSMAPGNTWTLYAAGYDADGNFRGNESVTWDETDTLDDVSATGTYYTFAPTTVDTSGTITVEHASSGQTDATGEIRVELYRLFLPIVLRAF